MAVMTEDKVANFELANQFEHDSELTIRPSFYSKLALTIGCCGIGSLGHEL